MNQIFVIIYFIHLIPEMVMISNIYKVIFRIVFSDRFYKYSSYSQFGLLICQFAYFKHHNSGKNDTTQVRMGYTIGITNKFFS